VTGVAAEVEQALRDLAREANRLADELSAKKPNVIAIGADYQTFYTKALPLVRTVAPDRYDEFISCYENPKRRSLDVSTYGVRDFLRGLPLGVSDGQYEAAINVVHQADILAAVSARASSVLGDVRTALLAEVLDEDLSVAGELLKFKHVRAAGAVAGVVLERHLASLAQAHGIKITKKAPTIADLNDPLRDAGVYDIVQWRRLQAFADIRNLAVHAKEREPTAAEIADLIDGVAHVVKTIF
jgi:hypothetical protein